ncbi:hypothetical protein [Nocardia sp. CNY236]|uniref:hypothetical protein n=1 Tax=Nocardia sp. CNY236 TaxID=1169152 RepID=UPI00041ADC60|nr:hypothetical protein [Nocardia sp. CNY236]
MSENINCQATRRGRNWDAHVPEYGAFASGRTLKQLRKNIEGALALAGVTAEITITPTSPELETLRTSKDTYTAALRETVATLALRSTTKTDIALATEIKPGQVKALLAEPEPHRTSRHVTPSLA